MTRWNVLSGGACAVVAAFSVLALGACAAPADGPAAGPDRAVLAGSETSSATPSAEPSEPQIDPMPTGGETPSGGQPWDAAATEACKAVVDTSFTQVAQSADEAGVTTFWTSGKRWVACDVAGEADPAVIESKQGRPGFDEESLALSTTMLPGDNPSVRFVAGGRLPWPVQEISYSFPDGHTAKARFVTSQDDPEVTWWVVGYTATEGPLVDPETKADELDPATISIIGAAAEAFRLPWEDLQRSE